MTERIAPELPEPVRAMIARAMKQRASYSDVAMPENLKMMAVEFLTTRREYLDLAIAGLGLKIVSDDAVVSAPPIDSEESWQPDLDKFNIDAFNREFALVISGGSALIIHEQPAGPPEDRLRFLKKDGFLTLFQNRFKKVRGPDGKEKYITWATAWLQHKDRRQYIGLEFYPDPENGGGHPGYLNLWRGFAYAPRKGGTCHIFKDHLLNNVCHGDERLYRWVFGWFAQIFQQPREKPGTSIVLRGAMGAGKSKIGEIVGVLLGGHYFQVDDPRYITGNFNTHMSACLLLQAEEAVWAGDKTAEGRLKGLVTSKFQMIEAKGVDPIRLPNYVRIVQTSNEDWVVPAGKDERRFAVFDISAHCANNHNYFRSMDDELKNGGYEQLLHEFLTFDLSAINLRDIPKNSALLDQKVRSLDPVEAWLLDRLRAGAPTKHHRQWPDFVTTDGLRADYLRASEEVGIRRKSHETVFGAKLNKLLPGLRRRQRLMVEDDSVTMRRQWGYELPHLDDCRREFEAVLGQEFDWGTDKCTT